MDHTREITKFIVEEFVPDISAEDLAADYDLLAGGVIDSLGLLKVIAWLEDRFELAVDDIDLEPDSFRTIAAINAFVNQAGQPAGAQRQPADDPRPARRAGQPPPPRRAARCGRSFWDRLHDRRVDRAEAAAVLAALSTRMPDPQTVATGRPVARTNADRHTATSFPRR